MPHYHCHGGTKPVRDLTNPPVPAPQGLASSFQAGLGRLPGRCSSLTWLRAGRSQSHIKLSEDPKVPVRSVNSSIVPPPRLGGDGCNRAPAPPPPTSTGPPRGYGDTRQLLLGERRSEPDRLFLFVYHRRRISARLR